MSCGFEAVDRDGIVVRCRHETWDGHVLDEHPELRGQQAAVSLTLRDPFYVFQSDRHLGRKVFYRTFTLPKPYDRYYLRVVVRYFGKGRKLRGELVTAFAAANIRHGDILIWSKYAQTTP